MSELCQALSLAKSSVFDLAETLTASSILEKNEDTKRYSLGGRLIEFGNRAQSQFDIVRLAHPLLAELSENTGETAHLTVLDNDEVLYVDCVESSRRFRTASVIGARAPLHCTAVGKAILAYLPEPEQSRIMQSKGLPPFTRHTIQDPGQMRAELRRIVKQGYAIDNMEHEEFLRCIGAPIFNDKGEAIASVSVSGPSERNTLKRLATIAETIVDVTQKISQKIGYRKNRS